MGGDAQEDFREMKDLTKRLLKNITVKNKWSFEK